MKARSKSAKNRAPRQRKMRRKPMNTAVVPVAVSASPDAGKAIIPITRAKSPNGDQVVPVAVRRASGEVVIPAQVNAKGRKRAVSIRVAVKGAAKRKNGRREEQRVQRQRLPERDPITNALVSATRIEENVVTLAAQVGITALDVLEHWSRFLLNRGVRVAKATERGMMSQAVRALDAPLPNRATFEAEVSLPGMRQPEQFRAAA